MSCSICKKTGHKWVKCIASLQHLPLNRTRPQQVPKAAKEDANLAISDQVGLVVHAKSESYEFAKSNDAEDAFVSVSQEKYVFRFDGSGGTQGLDCEIR